MSTSTKPKVAEYRWEGTNSNGDPVLYEKWIVVEHDENTDELTVTFKASQKADGSFSNVPGVYDRWSSVDWTKHDEKTFNWDRFLELMSAIEGGADDEGGREFVRSVFVGGHSGPAAVSRQGVVSSEVDNIATLDTDDTNSDELGDHLRLYWQTGGSPNCFSMCWMRPNGSPHPKNIYCWRVQDHELQQLLVEDPDTDKHVEATKGFTREFRKALFLNLRRHRVIEML